ncbi:hypothetical protein NLJ89_g8689 [Agrocybe chaxingu]|uniref:Uncharacterized protein n=1 Tax=Agrocybe chaxingu TaxID=84603 RepID=A0A9W8JUV1_9AGAR|nr:hypothetical protein NLJ89_g8689 [Agrocybe chaxingu]
MQKSWRLITPPEVATGSDSEQERPQAQHLRPLRLRSSWLTSTYPWNNKFVSSERQLSDVFGVEHPLHLFVKLLEALEQEKCNSFDAEAMKFKSTLRIDDPFCPKDDQLIHMRLDAKTAIPLCSYLCGHKLVDVTSLLFNEGIPGDSIPTHPKHHHFGDIDGKSWEQLHDWPNLLKKMHTMLQKAKLVTGDDPSPQPVTTGTTLPAQHHLVLLNSIVGRDSSMKLTKILSNVEIATMHLNIMLQGHVDLPDKINWFSTVASVSGGELSQEARTFLKPFIKTPHRLRLPLHLALLISPIYLLVFAQLHKKDWDRWKLVLSSLLLGNQKPRLLTSSELALWRAILAVAHGKNTILALLDELDALPWERLASVPEEHRLWFKPAHIQANPASPLNAGIFSAELLLTPEEAARRSTAATSTMSSEGPDSSAVSHVSAGMHIDGGGKGGAEAFALTHVDEMVIEQTALGAHGDQNSAVAEGGTGKQPASVPENEMVVEQTTLTAHGAQDGMAADGPNQFASAPLDEMVVETTLSSHGEQDSIAVGGGEDEMAIEHVTHSARGDQDNIAAGGGEDKMAIEQAALSARGDQDSKAAEGENEVDVEQTTLSTHGDRDNTAAIQQTPLDTHGDRANKTAEQTSRSTDGDKDNAMDVDRSDQTNENIFPPTAPNPGGVKEPTVSNPGGAKTLTVPNPDGEGLPAEKTLSDDDDDDEHEQIDAEMIGRHDRVSTPQIQPRLGPDLLSRYTSSIAPKVPVIPPLKKAATGASPSVQIERRTPFPSHNFRPEQGSSMHDAIDIDAIMEEIRNRSKTTLDVKSIPNKHTSDRPTLLYTPEGQQVSIRPSFHTPEMMDCFHSIAKGVEASFIAQQPPHVADPNRSVLAVMTLEEYNTKGVREIQAILRRKHIVVTGLPPSDLKFDEAGLETLASLDAIVDIQDQSLSFTDDCNDILRQGTLRQILECSRMKNGKTLNALNFPMGVSGVRPSPVSSDLCAWRHTAGLPFCKSTGPVYPVDDVQWGLVATDGAFHGWHVDSDGFGTVVEVQTGRKWWVLARPRGDDPDFNDFARIRTFLGEIDTSAPNLDRWELEAVLLKSGSRLVFGSDQHQSPRFETPPATRKHFPRPDANNEFISILSLAAVLAHLFDLSESHTPLDVIIFAALIVFLTALDFQTYESTEATSDLPHQNPMSFSERLSAAYARGMAMELVKWTFHHYDVKNLETGDDVPHPYVEVFGQYLFSLSQTLAYYKGEALSADMYGPDECTVQSFTDQLENALSTFPRMEMIKFRYQSGACQPLTLAPESRYLFTLKQTTENYVPSPGNREDAASEGWALIVLHIREEVTKQLSELYNNPRRDDDAAKHWNHVASHIDKEIEEQVSKLKPKIDRDVERGIPDRRKRGGNRTDGSAPSPPGGVDGRGLRGYAKESCEDVRKCGGNQSRLSVVEEAVKGDLVEATSAQHHAMKESVKDLTKDCQMAVRVDEAHLRMASIESNCTDKTYVPRQIREYDAGVRAQANEAMLTCIRGAVTSESNQRGCPSSRKQWRATFWARNFPSGESKEPPGELPGCFPVSSHTTTQAPSFETASARDANNMIPPRRHETGELGDLVGERNTANGTHPTTQRQECLQEGSPSSILQGDPISPPPPSYVPAEIRIRFPPQDQAVASVAIAVPASAAASAPMAPAPAAAPPNALALASAEASKFQTIPANQSSCKRQAWLRV